MSKQKKESWKDYNVHIDIKKLSWWLSTQTDEVFFLHSENDMHPDYRYIYKKASEPADILLVAHLDTVQDLTGITKRDGAIIEATGLDDRLGAYIAWDWMKDNGFNVDVLLTDHEEIGKSTAEFFGLANDYNWIVEFDRARTDAVTYGIESDEWLDVLEEAGFEIGQGAFSDICFLDNPVCCVNIGCGYHRAHAMSSFMDLRETQMGLQKFSWLYDNYRHERFETKQAQGALQQETRAGRDSFYDDDSDDDYKSVEEYYAMQAEEHSPKRTYWFRDEQGELYHTNDPQLSDSDPLLCSDCNSPALPTDLGVLCMACFNHYDNNLQCEEK